MLCCTVAFGKTTCKAVGPHDYPEWFYWSRGNYPHVHKCWILHVLWLSKSYLGLSGSHRFSCVFNRSFLLVLVLVCLVSLVLVCILYCSTWTFEHMQLKLQWAFNYLKVAGPYHLWSMGSLWFCSTFVASSNRSLSGMLLSCFPENEFSSIRQSERKYMQLMLYITRNKNNKRNGRRKNRGQQQLVQVNEEKIVRFHRAWLLTI